MEPQQSYRILVIDDTHEIHDDFRKVLAPASHDLSELKEAIFGEPAAPVASPSYEIDSAYDGESGWSLVKKSVATNKPYFMAFVDIKMPGWDGIKTIKKIWEVDPDLQVVICTAYSDYTWQETIDALGITDRFLILRKPFDNIEIRQITCALHQKWHLALQNRHQFEQLQEMVDERTSEIHATLEATTDGILAITKNGEIAEVNGNFFKLWEGLSWEESSMRELIERKDLNAVIRFMSANLLGEMQDRSILEAMSLQFDESSFVESAIELKIKNGRFVELYSKPLCLNDVIIGRVMSFRDVTDRIHYEEQLSFQATHDLLTQLPNRLLLVDRLEQAIVQAKREKTHIAVLYLDLDRFKNINDSLGHHCGDELLKGVAERLARCIRESDTICRAGGDEFIAIIPGLHEEHRVISVVQKIQNELKKTFIINNRPLTISTSVGISFFPENGQDAEDLLKNADGALYQAKASGRNTFNFFSEEMNIQAQQRLDLEQHLFQAYELGEFLLYYQPLIDARTGEICSTEALLRWQHPLHGLIQPSKFISIAEDTGLIVPLGEWVLRTACVQNLQWQQMGLPAIPIAVNLSGYQTKKKELLQSLEKILNELKYSWNLLELELTENVLLESSEELEKTFEKVQHLGASLVVDDFGTGYSNLSYLLHFNVKKLKIDRSFIRNIDKDQIDVVIVKAVIALAHSLKMQVVAEGVETKEQFQFLYDNDCDQIQGYYFSEPLDAQSYTELLKKKMPIPTSRPRS